MQLINLNAQQQLNSKDEMIRNIQGAYLFLVWVVSKRTAIASNSS